AHVDAGKTTLSESILYESGVLRKVGRVDHGDAFLDTFELEKERGITIFSKMARLQLGEYDVTLLDTPGHADFSPEMERTLQVLDAAILVISAADGVTGQVMVLWKLLSHYNVPVYLFVNKMDQPGSDKMQVLDQLKDRLSSHIVAFDTAPEDDEFQEEVAVCDDKLLEAFLEDGTKVNDKDISRLIYKRKLFPVMFGSALKMEGIKEFLDTIIKYVEKPSYSEEFGAKVFKISRDSSGTRLSWLKVTGGSVISKSVIELEKDGEIVSEKIDQIRLYSGEKFENVKEAVGGQIVAVTGLVSTYSGQGIGIESSNEQEILQPVLSCRLIFPEGTDNLAAYRNMMALSEEEPMLSITQNGENGDMHAQVMGTVQMEILKNLIMERFGLDVSFGPAEVVYKETIKDTVEGVGHFEPLRHYAEVHLLLMPTEPGSGLTFEADCPLDELDRNWQRLILTHLHEKKHIGVLTGSEITDMKITLIAGRAHNKHTEGGDFREATYRAVRQGLMEAESILLEPVYDFRMVLPSDALGRALNDISRMNGRNNPPDMENGKSVITGVVPAACFGNYAEELASFTRGEGHVSISLRGYEPCHNAEEIIAEKGYFPEFDTVNPASSVFCSHGAGTIIPWDEVRNYMHVDTGWRAGGEQSSVTDLNADLELAAYKARKAAERADNRSFKDKEKDFYASQNELDAIFERTYGKIKRKDLGTSLEPKTIKAEPPKPKYRAPVPYENQKEYLLVDGYNIIYANKKLAELAGKDMKAARDSLMDTLSNFQGFRREIVILVFDAYRVAGGKERVFKYNTNLNVVFTKEAETADQYIEKAAHEIGKKYKVTVATSDAVEQVIIFGGGAFRMSANDFWAEIEYTENAIRDKL
ncbi:MAG: TetM/TetW/TetO/TetS family tetracycline resistance ribosomal protection protein, partial [Butyrivibrio sp.]|nr:TetM/TetW/TetO/TetS family tetracycline resistance ribosomal protection protein [Butyrivibrio sp.]